MQNFNPSFKIHLKGHFLHEDFADLPNWVSLVLSYNPYGVDVRLSCCTFSLFSYNRDS